MLVFSKNTVLYNYKQGDYHWKGGYLYTADAGMIDVSTGQRFHSTEVLHLAGHKGQLCAGNGYWMDAKGRSNTSCGPCSCHRVMSDGRNDSGRQVGSAAHPQVPRNCRQVAPARPRFLFKTATFSAALHYGNYRNLNAFEPHTLKITEEKDAKTL